MTSPAHRLLFAALLATTLLFVVWSLFHAQPLTGLLVFALPAGLLTQLAWRGWPRVGFTAALLALLWFCHGVMLTWSDPAQRPFAGVEIVLSLSIFFAACLPGIQARRSRFHDHHD
jgi:uncharacterized membrane protein